MRCKSNEINIEELGNEFMKASEINEREEEIADEIREYIRWNKRGEVADKYYFRETHLEDLIDWYLNEEIDARRPHCTVGGIANKVADGETQLKEYHYYVTKLTRQTKLSDFEGDWV